MAVIVSLAKLSISSVERMWSLMYLRLYSRNLIILWMKVIMKFFYFKIIVDVFNLVSLLEIGLPGRRDVLKILYVKDAQFSYIYIQEIQMYVVNGRSINSIFKIITPLISSFCKLFWLWRELYWRASNLKQTGLHLVFRPNTSSWTAWIEEVGAVIVSEIIKKRFMGYFISGLF